MSKRVSRIVKSARNNYRVGYLSVFDTSGTILSYSARSNGYSTDSRNVRGDWSSVGGSVRAAMRKSASNKPAYKK